MLRDKNLNLLPILLALLEEESVVAAARRVHLSQPAVSGALARLREEFDDPILVRVGRQMRRTSRSERLLPQVKLACAELDRLFDYGVFDPAQSDASFVVAAPDHLALPVARELQPLLMNEAPNVEVRIVDAPNDLPRHLREGNIDIAVAGNFDMWAGVSYESVIRERFVAAMSTDHPLAGRDAVTLKDIESYASVARNSHPLTSRAEGPLTTGVPVLDLQRQIAVEQFVTAVMLSVGTELVIPAPKLLVDSLAQNLPLVGIPFDQEYSAEAGLFWAPFQDDSPEIDWLRSVLVRCLIAAEGKGSSTSASEL